MNDQSYTISTLTDYSRLTEIYRLTHDTLVEIRHLNPRGMEYWQTLPRWIAANRRRSSLLNARIE